MVWYLQVVAYCQSLPGRLQETFSLEQHDPVWWHLSHPENPSYSISIHLKFRDKHSRHRIYEQHHSESFPSGGAWSKLPNPSSPLSSSGEWSMVVANIHELIATWLPINHYTTESSGLTRRSWLHVVWTYLRPVLLFHLIIEVGPPCLCMNSWFSKLCAGTRIFSVSWNNKHTMFAMTLPPKEEVLTWFTKDLQASKHNDDNAPCFGYPWHLHVPWQIGDSGGFEAKPQVFEGPGSQ